MKTKCSLEISRIQTNEGSKVLVTMQDMNSRIQFARGFMSLEDLSKIITGQGGVEFECNLTFENVGKTREIKYEMVQTRGCYSSEALSKIWPVEVQPFEINGWKGREYDYLNGKNDVSSTARRVLFERWV